ncbi:MAG TPA: hypothetical protein GX529_07935 [Firmicutes bacterium]|nr:hypothetical protein [Candidatus Fermentithermobacillaceae bacterium]
MQKTPTQAGRKVGIGEMSIIMEKAYGDYTQNQPVLMLPSLRGWLPEGRLAFVIIDITDAAARIRLGWK